MAQQAHLAPRSFTRTGPCPSDRAACGPDTTFSTLSWHAFTRGDRIAAWDALAQWAIEPNPFYESWYLLPSLAAFDPRGKVSLLVLHVDGQLAGLMPVSRAASYYSYPVPHVANWVHANCFCGQPLVAHGFERLFWRKLLAWADRHAGTALFLHLSHLPLDGPLHDALAAALKEDGRGAATVLREERAMLATTMAADDYLEQSLTTKKRKELRRQHRRLAEEGDLSVERHCGSDGIDAWTGEFLALESRGWKGKAGSALASDPRTASLFTKALRGAAGRGKLERIALRLDGRPIAMLANFLTPPGAYSYKTAFDEAFARYSPGVLLQRENLALAERGDIDWIDSCAAEDHPMIDHIWRERRAIGRHSLAIGGALRRAAFARLLRYETGAPSAGIAA